MRIRLFILCLLLLTLSAIAQTPAHTVTLNWTASADAAANSALAYNVYRADGTCPTLGEPTSPTLMGTTAAGVTSYKDSNVSTSKTYCYVVRATLNGVESNGNPTAVATVPLAPAIGLTAAPK